MSCPRPRFFIRAPSNWLGVGAAYVGVAAPLPTTEPFSGVPARIALGALVDLSVAQNGRFQERWKSEPLRCREYFCEGGRGGRRQIDPIEIA